MWWKFNFIFINSLYFYCTIYRNIFRPSILYSIGQCQLTKYITREKFFSGVGLYFRSMPYNIYLFFIMVFQSCNLIRMVCLSWKFYSSRSYFFLVLNIKISSNILNLLFQGSSMWHSNSIIILILSFLHSIWHYIHTYVHTYRIDRHWRTIFWYYLP